MSKKEIGQYFFTKKQMTIELSKKKKYWEMIKIFPPRWERLIAIEFFKSFIAKW